jgi:colanic acid biosynthesis glycosyl transferase WcaI
MVHYSGTFGLAHEEHTIIEAMRHLRDDRRFRFVFAGGGARRERLEEFCRVEEIGTAEFQPYPRRSELGRTLAEGHVGLVTQMPRPMGAVVPSKPTESCEFTNRCCCSNFEPEARARSVLRFSLGRKEESA